MKQFKLPDVGEGLTEAEIVSWKVKPGDTVKVNEIVVEIETAKSLVELPSPFAGVVTELLVAEGTTVDVGTPIITVDTGEPGDAGLAGGDAAAGGRLRVTTWRHPSPPQPARSAPRVTTRPSSRPDRRPRAGRAHLGAGRLRPAYDLGGAPAAQGSRADAVGASAAAAQQAVQTSMMTTPVPLVEPDVDEAELSAPATTSRAVDDRRRRRCSPSRRCASWPRTSASTSRRCRPSGAGGTITRDDVEAAASTGQQVWTVSAPAGRPAPALDGSRMPTAASARRAYPSRACAR